MALMDKPGAHVWHQWTDQEHTCGTAGQTRSTHVAKPSGHESHVWCRWTAGEQHGADGQGAHAWHQRPDWKHTSGIWH